MVFLDLINLMKLLFQDLSFKLKLDKQPDEHQVETNIGWSGHLSLYESIVNYVKVLDISIK